MTALLISFAKIGASLALLAIVLYGVSLIARRARIAPEIARKVIHVSLGLYCLTFPVLFTQSWEVALTCALAIGVFLAARFAMRDSLGAGLYGVERRSFGEIYFALAVAYLFIARESHGDDGSVPADLVYIVPLLVLTISDAAAALIGARFGRLRFNVGDGTKSVEGAAAFFVTAWFLSFAALANLTQMSPPDALRLSFMAAAFGAVLESISWRGFDNFSVPFGAYLVLAYAAPGAQFHVPTDFAFLFPL